MDPQRREDLVDFIRAHLADFPWPRIEKDLQERGYKADEIAAGVDEVFPSAPRKSKNRAAVKAGLYGAIAGIVAWLAFVLIYRAGGFAGGPR